MPTVMSPFPPGWSKPLQKIHGMLDGCLSVIIKDGYVYYFAIQKFCLHAVILPESDTFARAGAIYETDDMEVDRIIGSCGALSFLHIFGKIRVFSQKRTGVVQVYECLQGESPDLGDILRFLSTHTGLPHFSKKRMRKTWILRNKNR